FRERLVRRLAVTGARVVLLRAPAGYGKTELLRSWAQGDDPRAFVWLAPDDAPPAGAGGPNRPGGPRPPPRGPAAAAHRLHPGPRLVIAARAAVPLGRLRAQHDVLELGPAELALTRREATAALAAAGVVLRPRPLRALLDRLEGWPAMLSLAAQLLRDADDPD